jgi:hypothetical protein
MTSEPRSPFDVANLARLGLGCAPLGDLSAPVSEVDTARGLVERLTPGERAAMFGGTAARVYGLVQAA